MFLPGRPVAATLGGMGTPHLRSASSRLAAALLLAAGWMSLAATAALAQSRLAQTPSHPKNLQVLPRTDTVPQVLAVMRTFTTGLGVRCSFCHVEGDFASDQQPAKQVARRMLRMVEAINRQNFSGRPEVSCYTCHRGATHPLRQPPAAAHPEPGPGEHPPAIAPKPGLDS